jgi:sugar transferase EpsL
VTAGRTRATPSPSKRLLDVTLAATGLVLLSPLLAALAILVRLRLGSPVLFRQERAGLGGRPFILYKFRTMTDERDRRGVLLPDGQRLPPFGAALRATSLDELPELWNVLRGDMSLVGPRPLPTTYLPRYTPLERRRHDVPPGLTGWAQINGRNAVGWDDRLAMDVWYVEHRTLWLDVRILIGTVRKVLSRAGIAGEGEATMGELRPEHSVGPSDVN